MPRIFLAVSALVRILQCILQASLGSEHVPAVPPCFPPSLAITCFASLVSSAESQLVNYDLSHFRALLILGLNLVYTVPGRL